jgi:hypothetical protein
VTRTSSFTSTSTSTSLLPCYTAKSEYLINPGFEASSGNTITPWTSTDTGFDYSVQNDNSHSSGRVFRGTAPSSSSSTLKLTQANIKDLPAGTTVTVSAWIKPMRDAITTSNSLSFNLKFDGTSVQTLTASNANKNGWIQMTGSIIVSNAASHTVSLEVNTKGKNGNIFAVDDFSVKATIPAAGYRFCTK